MILRTKKEKLNNFIKKKKFTGVRCTNIISKLYDVFKKIYVLEITIYQNIELKNMN